MVYTLHIKNYKSKNIGNRFRKDDLRQKSWEELFAIYKAISVNGIDRDEQREIRFNCSRENLKNAIIGAQIPSKEFKNPFDMFN